MQILKKNLKPIKTVHENTGPINLRVPQWRTFSLCGLTDIQAKRYREFWFRELIDIEFPEMWKLGKVCKTCPRPQLNLLVPHNQCMTMKKASHCVLGVKKMWMTDNGNHWKNELRTSRRSIILLHLRINKFIFMSNVVSTLQCWLAHLYVMEDLKKIIRVSKHFQYFSNTGT